MEMDVFNAMCGADFAAGNESKGFGTEEWKKRVLKEKPESNEEWAKRVLKAKPENNDETLTRITQTLDQIKAALDEVIQYLANR